MNKIFETTNRTLEQYLYMNGIKHRYSYKNEAYETVWQYERTPWLAEVLQMYGKFLEYKKTRRIA